MKDFNNIQNIPDFTNSLKKEFYLRNTNTIAKELIGKALVRNIDGICIAGKIVETEAYLADNDMASHSVTGKSRRNEAMFETGSILYVYKIYGVHYCINVVTEDNNKGCAVLIRSIEPLLGIEKMIENRGINNINNLCKGPGNVAKAFGFNLDDNFSSLIQENLFIQNFQSIDDENIGCSNRIGIAKSSDLMLRYYEKNNSFVSGNKKIHKSEVVKLSNIRKRQ